MCCGIILVTHTGRAVAMLPWSGKPTANLSPASVALTDFTDRRIDSRVKIRNLYRRLGFSSRRDQKNHTATCVAV